MKKLIKSLVVGLVIGLTAVPQYNVVFARSYGHYTETLPGPSSINTAVTEGTLYWNGTDWGITTVAPAATMGDSISRSGYTAWQSLDISTITNNIAVTTFTALPGTGRSVGSATLPIGWATAGRTIRIVQKGVYSTGVATNWTWQVFLGTTSIMSTGALPAVASQLNKPFTAEALITVSTGGAAGVVNGQYTIFADSGTAPCTVVSYSTFSAANVSVELTGQRAINSTFKWGTALGSTLIVTNSVIELLN